jgi:hypothetical protein
LLSLFLSSYQSFDDEFQNFYLYFENLIIDWNSARGRWKYLGELFSVSHINFLYQKLEIIKSLGSSEFITQDALNAFFGEEKWIVFSSYFLKNDSEDPLQSALHSKSFSIENVFQIYVWNLLSQKYSSSYLFNIFTTHYSSTDFLPNLFEVLSFLIQPNDFVLKSVDEIDMNALVDQFLKRNLISDDLVLNFLYSFFHLPDFGEKFSIKFVHLLNEKIQKDDVFNFYVNSLVEYFPNNLQIRIYTELALQEEFEDNEYLEKLNNIPNGIDYYKSVENLENIASEPENSFIDDSLLLI